MKFRKHFGSILAGTGAGIINGLFGAGGGMILVPLLTAFTDLEDEEIFPASISVMLPVCLVTLTITGLHNPIDWSGAIPYLIGSAAGGVLAGLLGKKIPTTWLHRGLGLLIIWGGIRYLC